MNATALLVVRATVMPFVLILMAATSVSVWKDTQEMAVYVKVLYYIYYYIHNTMYNSTSVKVYIPLLIIVFKSFTESMLLMLMI